MRKALSQQAPHCCIFKVVWLCIGDEISESLFSKLWFDEGLRLVLISISFSKKRMPPYIVSIVIGIGKNSIDTPGYELFSSELLKMVSKPTNSRTWTSFLHGWWYHFLAVTLVFCEAKKLTKQWSVCFKYIKKGEADLCIYDSFPPTYK